MAKLLRIGVTLLVVAAAIIAGNWVWNHYLYAPWTRDGRVRADVITLAPDVSGWVTKLDVVNNQAVSKGDLLFTIDDVRYKANIVEAEAYVVEKRSAWELATHQYERRQGLSGRQAISDENLETYRIYTESARASYELARAQLKTIQIDLSHTRMVAPEAGTISNISLREGNYVTKGAPVLSLLKKDSFYVTGYFEETKLQAVYVGQQARITLMGGGHEFSGTVTSIAQGIADTNTSSNSELLPQVKQVVNWVRLAQRIPVEIALDPLPDNIHISAGMTVSIYLDADQ